MNYVSLEKTNFNIIYFMQVATTNADCKIGWTSKFLPHTQYMISSDNLILSGDKTDVDRTLLLRATINESMGQGGGGFKREFRLRSNKLEDGFKELESKMEGYFRKNNLEIKNREFILTLKSLDDGKYYFKKYGKKNI